MLSSQMILINIEVLFTKLELYLENLCRGISSEEKLYLRQKLLAHLREENYQVVLVWYKFILNLLVTYFECHKHIIGTLSILVSVCFDF